MQTERRAFNKNKKAILDAVANLGPGDYLRLRRLTVRESLRLQGLVDSDINKMILANGEAECYKQSGNSICVPVLTHLFRRLLINRIGPDEGQSYPLY